MSSRRLRAIKVLCRIFSFGVGFGERDFGAVLELYEMLASGSIRLEGHALPEVSLEPDLLDVFSGRTDSHRVLCARGARWLELNGYAWRSKGASLVYAPGAVGDVASNDGKVVVEAGFTRASKVRLATQHGVSLLVVPYLTPVRGFLFMPRGVRVRRWATWTY